jgi:hypothetical protein
VSADGSTVCVLILRLNSSCSRSIALVVRALRHTGPPKLPYWRFVVRGDRCSSVSRQSDQACQCRGGNAWRDRAFLQCEPLDDFKAFYMRAAHLSRIDPARNMWRFYRIDVEPDLFGGWPICNWTEARPRLPFAAGRVCVWPASCVDGRNVHFLVVRFWTASSRLWGSGSLGANF